MRTLLCLVLVGMALADKRPNGFNGNGLSSGYGAPSANGNGNGNGNGYAYDEPAEPSNGYGAPAANGNGNGNGYSNGNGRRNGNGNGNGRNGNGYGAPSAPSNSYGAPGEEEDPIAALGENIPGGGVPGEDYPILSEVPDTGFLCEDQAGPGYYADVAPEAGCQVFHICQDQGGRIRKDSFLCPNGTIFNQQYFVCDWWYNFDCSTAEEFFSLNEAIGQEEGAADGPYGASGQPESNGYGNGNGRKNGNGNGRKNGNGNGNGYGAPSAPSSSYGTPA